ncbi:AMP-binding protein [Lentzea flaviverrucosa]|uniref:3-phosphoshikimate 1-carboxyvinyltransferase/cyclohexanecarboxylate-CoA ligase n=1 Tax=Lentzea flaviverrucosa TaxID=200379 RepID=A0A1H9WTJ2_9PSEU|nr:AMP-binding protein [Lentzea flaviverrucosa]RDI23092.1 cyclohexanecarboxylate-CoA ligase [Lentzea flaviverrucosa]SES37262.1 3-phosphoshikimate 1-carboxyvinyltransferase/cyclohexanecarboxylate-CoA ligase [Lentzea flaviverrucosa]
MQTTQQIVAASLVDLVKARADERPDEVAVVDLGTAAELTWRELVERADRMAAYLHELGVAPGEVVVMQLPNRAEFVVTALAVLRIGAVVAPVMPIFRERELGFVLRRARARVLVVQHAFRNRQHVAEVDGMIVNGLADGLEHVVVVDGETGAAQGVRWHRFEDVLTGDGSLHGVAPTAADGIAQLLFTSGTTGEPKAVLHRMGSLSRAAVVMARRLGLTGADRVHIASPMAHHSGFLYGMWVALVLGAVQVLQPVWHAGRALEAFATQGGTFMQAATPFLLDLVDAVEGGARKPESLRTFVVTGAAVPRALAERARVVLGTAVCGAWGSTETCMGTLSSPLDEPEKVWGTDGRPLEGVAIRVTDDDGRALAAGQEGHLEVVSACGFDHYLDRPDWTAEAHTDDGWYRTGDLAVIDEAGYLRIVGRVRDVINRGGEKVPVGEVEQLMYRHPAVAEVAIVAMPDPRLGERACAYVTLRPGSELDLAGLHSYLDGARLAKQYWPERLEVVGELPRNPAGKIQKFVLREHARAIVTSSS